ncbi:hypothetical protein FOL47_004621 [Perkinsus chesapeaki]|uniref:C2H2-type domain-containing protein n=1 Tax=Perkinsus chesapeaki TaxID=330153 RepID=A0A7J6M1J5_PERCH|nr:hypothetical protein FOL47_004621 [Perkinsus chesapeaki]
MASTTPLTGLELVGHRTAEDHDGGFNFRKNNNDNRLRWRQVCRPELVDSILSKGDVGRLQDVLEEIAFAHVSLDDLQTVGDAQILALIRLLQLGLEFTLSMYSQTHQLTEQMMGRVSELTATKKKLKAKLIANMNDNHPTVPRGVPCGDCGKRFEDGHYLTDHVKRRHAVIQPSENVNEKENTVQPRQEVADEGLLACFTELSSKIDEFMKKQEPMVTAAALPVMPDSEALVNTLVTESRKHVANMREELEMCVKEMVSEKMRCNLSDIAEEIDRKLGALDERQKSATIKHEEWIAANLQRAVSKAVTFCQVKQEDTETFAGELEDDDYDNGDCVRDEECPDELVAVPYCVQDGDDSRAAVEVEIEQLRRQREADELMRRMSTERRESIIAEMQDMFKSVVSDCVVGKMLLENSTPKLTADASCQPSPNLAGTPEDSAVGENAAPSPEELVRVVKAVRESITVQAPCEQEEERVEEAPMATTEILRENDSLEVDEHCSQESAGLRETPEASLEPSDEESSITSTRVQSAVMALQPSVGLRSVIESLPTSERVAILVQGSMEGLLRGGSATLPSRYQLSSPRAAVVDGLFTASLSRLHSGRAELVEDELHENENATEDDEETSQVVDDPSEISSQEESDVLPLHQVVAERKPYASGAVDAEAVCNSIEVAEPTTGDRGHFRPADSAGTRTECFSSPGEAPQS